MTQDVRILPDGGEFILRNTYTESQARAIGILIFISVISLVAVVGLISAISISAWNTRNATNPNLFVRTNVVTYFVSLLICALFQAIGSIITSTWVQQMAVSTGSLCTAQGVIKHISDIGIAIWSLVIAVHTALAFWTRGSKAYFESLTITSYNIRVKKLVHWGTLVVTWTVILAIVIGGPTTVDQVEHGDYYGISGEWCWITQQYTVQQVVLAYLIMFLSALASLCLYAYVFYRIRKRSDKPSSKYGLSEQDAEDEYQTQLIKHMILYPFAYFVLLLPIAIARFTYWSGHDVPFGATIFCDAIYLLVGIVFTGLFISARRILPPRSAIPKFLIISGPLPWQDPEGQVVYDDPYYNPPDMFMAPRSAPPVKASLAEAGGADEHKSKRISVASSIFKPLPPPPAYTPTPTVESDAQPPRPIIPLRNPFTSRGMVAGGIARRTPGSSFRSLNSRKSSRKSRHSVRSAASSIRSADTEGSSASVTVKSATTTTSSSAFSIRSTSDAGGFDIVSPSVAPSSSQTAETTAKSLSAQDHIRSLAHQIDTELARAKASWRQSSSSESESSYVDADARELSEADITQHVMSASTVNGDDILRYYSGSPYTVSAPATPAGRR